MEKEHDPMRINYRELTDAEAAGMAELKAEYDALWRKLDDLPPSRELSMAKTELEASCMWMTKHVTR